MRRTCFIIGALLMLCLISEATSASSCADMVCPAGTDACCDDARLGATCYDSGIASCPSGSHGKILCGFQEHGADQACGWWCYDAAMYSCCNDTLYLLAASSENPCLSGTPTQPPSTAAPASPTSAPVSCGNSICPPGTDSCCVDARLGPTCYNSGIASCPTGSKGNVLCGFQEHGADQTCGLWCYDAVMYSCCNDTLFLAGQSPCDIGNTVAPTAAPTAAPASSCASMVCPPGTDSCCNDVKLGPTCYNSGIASCPSGSSGPVLCGFQEHGADQACGVWCYDAVMYECCEDTLYQIGASPCMASPTAAPTSAPSTAAPTSAPSTAAPTSAPSTSAPAASCSDMVCPPGTDSCCDDIRRGPTCYDSSIASCPTASQGPVLCGFQEHGADSACGAWCYDSVTYSCCNDTLFGINDASNPCMASPCDSKACASGDMCCDDAEMGPTCYDSTTYSCPSGSKGSLLCGFQEHGPDFACGLTCYDNTDYMCCDDVIYGRSAANIPMSCLGDNSEVASPDTSVTISVNGAASYTASFGIILSAIVMMIMI